MQGIQQGMEYVKKRRQSRRRHEEPSDFNAGLTLGEERERKREKSESERERRGKGVGSESGRDW